MNRHAPFPRAILLALLSTTATTQAPAAPQPRRAAAVLLVRGAPADVLLNEPLLQVIVGSAQMQKVIADAAGERFAATPAAKITVAMPALHAAGTFQLHVAIDFQASNPWTDADSGRVLDAVLDDLRKKIDRLMCEDPRRSYENRIEVLRHRLDDLESERTKRLAEAAAVDGGTTPLEHLQKQRLDLDQRLLEARLEIATETAAQERLEKMRAQLELQTEELESQRTELQKRRQEFELQIAQLSGEAKQLGTRANTDEEIQKQNDRAAAVQTQLAANDRKLERIAGQSMVPMRLLTQVVELMPTSIIQKQRAEARLRSLEGFAKDQSTREHDAADRGRQVASLREAAERLRGEAVVVQTLLTEVRGRNERLEPVRYNVFPASR